jgi:ABC-2 type transport system permease protein
VPAAGVRLFAARVAGAAVTASLVAGVLVGALGVLVSLRAGTVRQAQQTLGLAAVGLSLGPLLAWRALSPARQASLESALGHASPETLVAGAVGALATAALVLLLAALLRFRRTRLTLA